MKLASKVVWEVATGAPKDAHSGELAEWPRGIRVSHGRSEIEVVVPQGDSSADACAAGKDGCVGACV